MQPLYDQASPQSIEDFGKRLLNKTLRTVAGQSLISEDDLKRRVGARERASFGNLVERYFYGITPNNVSGEPDFPKAAVELKTTPIKKKTDGNYAAKERLVLGLINYVQEAKTDFATSSFYKKNKRMMLISYLHDKGVEVGDLLIKIAKLVEYDKLPIEDQKIIREDWEKIHVKIREGRAHELSEGDTLYLGACTKAVDSTIFREQVGAIPAKPRAYSFKSGYVTELVRRELGEMPKEEEKAVKDAEISAPLSFEDIVMHKFDLFIGRTIREIHSIVGDGLNRDSKDYYAALARRMLGVQGARVVEFDAAEVSMKTVQLKASGMPKEHMSFPAFKYNEVVKEQWDADEEADATKASFQKQIERRFFIVVYQCDGDCSQDDEKKLKKVMFWSMPFEDREEARYLWAETVKRIKEGHADDLPGASDNRVAHVRPHARDSADTEIVDGIPLVKKSFWLNNSYIKNIVG